MAYKKTLTGPGRIKLKLDHGDSDTPAMVYSRDEKGSASWDAATGEGELTCYEGDVIALTEDQLRWLNEQEDAVELAYSTARKGNPEYQ